MNGVLFMSETEKSIQSEISENKVTICESFHGTIEFIGKRWMGIIIYHLLDGPKRYHELLSEIDGISDRLLTERLKELETQSLVTKKVSKIQLRKVEYELTELGSELEPIIAAVLVWAKNNGCKAYKK